MTDYTTPSGSGTMMIRDDGNGTGSGALVEYWFKAGFSSDFYNGLQFQILVNGVTVNQTVNYPTGAAWLKVYSSTVYTTQTVTFKLLTATGLSGMGGPTTFSHLISRATVPGTPSPPVISNPTVNSLDAAWTAPGDGGSAITGYQIGYAISTGITPPSGPTTTVDVSSSPHTVTNLATGSFYYFWVRAKNAVGWGNWSTPSTGQTYLGAYVNVGGVWKLATPYVRTGGVWKPANTVFVNIPTH